MTNCWVFPNTNGNAMQTRYLEGRRHLVFPTTLLVAGVHEGSNGPVFYSAHALAKSAPRWNGMPILLEHPVGTAADFDVHDRQKVGVIFNTRFDSYKLRAEAWLDEDRLSRVAPDVLAMARRKETVEVSTGLFLDGPFLNGAIQAEELVPDHLALLPGKVGACSVAAGCGMFTR